jgi:hypothetical protein
MITEDDHIARLNSTLHTTLDRQGTFALEQVFCTEQPDSRGFRRAGAGCRRAVIDHEAVAAAVTQWLHARCVIVDN